MTELQHLHHISDRTHVNCVLMCAQFASDERLAVEEPELYTSLFTCSVILTKRSADNSDNQVINKSNISDMG